MTLLGIYSGLFQLVRPGLRTWRVICIFESSHVYLDRAVHGRPYQVDLI
jgi:hypothetical protein